MNPSHQLSELLALAKDCGIIVRREALGGEGGGLCRVGKVVILFVDTSADQLTQLSSIAQSLVSYDGLADHYLRPDLRDLLDRHRKSDGSS